jgi:hypothetical protein
MRSVAPIVQPGPPMTSQRVKVASASGRGTGRFLVRTLKSAFDFGQLCSVQRLRLEDSLEWMELHFCWHECGGESVRIATDSRAKVVAVDTWRIMGELSPSRYANIENLKTTLGISHSLDTVKRTIESPTGELIAVSFEFSHGARFLLARETPRARLD